MLGRKIGATTLSLATAATFLNIAPTCAQVPGQDGMAMTLLPVIHERGHDIIITPRGFRVQVPGTGIASDAQQVAVYQDPAKNFWYINKHGQPTPVSPQVMQSVYAQVQAQGGGMPGGPPMPPGAYPQSYPQGYAPPPVQQTTIVEQPSNSSSGSGVGTALLGTAGAFAGAATGAALVNSNNNYYNHPYYGVPYGTPVYRGGGNGAGAHNNGNSYYYYNNGQKQYVNADNNNQKLFQQFDQQGNWKDRNKWSKNLQGEGGRLGGGLRGRRGR